MLQWTSGQIESKPQRPRQLHTAYNYASYRAPPVNHATIMIICGISLEILGLNLGD
jgi:hypothetical protein